MKRSFLPGLAALAVMTLGTAPAGAQTVEQDSATGSGYRIFAPQSPDPSVLTGFSFDARSGPEGENPVGSVQIVTSGLGPGAPYDSGPVTCLRVIGNTAIIGWARTTYVRGMPIPGQENVGAVAYAQDNGTPGADLDRLQVERDYSPTPPTVCPTEFPPSAPCPVGSPGGFENLCNISFGEITIREAQPPPPVVCPGAAQTYIGTKGKDEITGTALNDLILGLAGHDLLNGANGDDCIRGNAGDDTVRGGGGDDLIHGGDGSDVHQGGNDNDKLKSADGVRDVVNCGPGVDRAWVDQLDRVKDCERVTVVVE